MLVTFDVSTSIGGLQKKKLHYGTTLWFKKKTRQLWRTITTTQFGRF